MTKSLRVSEAEVRAIVTPPRTKTWVPVAHSEVIDALDSAVEEYGIGVIDKHYSLSNDGSRMFSTWNLDAGTAERGYAIGFRNSIDKSLALGLTAGTNVFVCSNLMFSGDEIIFRKHTGGLTLEEITVMAGNAIAITLDKLRELGSWHDSLKEVPLTQEQCKILTFDMMKEKVFPPSQFYNFGDCVKEEFALSKERNLYTIHSGVTRLVREKSLFQIAETTKKLNRICDDWKKAA